MVDQALFVGDDIILRWERHWFTTAHKYLGCSNSSFVYRYYGSGVRSLIGDVPPAQ
jgi:hypothetical protein